MKAKLVDKDLGWAEFFRRAKEIRDARVRVGVLGDTEQGGMHEKGSPLTVAEVAAVNEFGTEDGHVPARSFLRSTFDEQREKLAGMGEKLIGAVLDGRMDTDQALGILGAQLAADIKAKITSNIPPPNAPSTVAAKGSDHTLIDTGAMRAAVTWSTGEGEE